MKKFKPTTKVISSWAEQGYSDHVREYTKSIETNPNAVLEFCDTAGTWLIDYEWEHDPIFKTAFDKIEESTELLGQFLHNNMTSTTITVFPSKPQITVEITWTAPQVGAVVWDRLLVECEDPVILTSLAKVLSKVNYKLPQHKEHRSTSPLNRFHPERFRSTRAHAENFARLYRQSADFNTGAITETSLNKALSHLMKELNEKGISYPRRYKNDKDDPSIVFNREIIFGIAYGRYSQAGRQIMDFPPGLCEMLANTDIGDVPVGEIKLPYVCQYLHFGTQQHLELDRGWLVDGAYIESRGGPGELKIVLTGKPINQTDLDLWYLNAEPCYAQSFRQQHSTISLDTALKTVLNDRLAEFFEKEDRAQGGGLVTKANEILAEKGLDASHVVDIGARTAQHEIDETNRRYPVFLEALKLIINGLLYITAYPEDIETTWPESAPLAVREKALHGNAKERDKAKSKLMEMGYSPVHICGRSLKFPHQASLAATTGEGHKSLHWRRGHWRNQPFGVGRTEHRLRWIMPMLVGTKNSPGDDPELGHIYTVKSN